MFIDPIKRKDIPPMTLMSMWNQLKGAAKEGVQGGFAKVGETIQKTPLLKLGVNVLNAADYGLGTVAKTTEGLLTDRVNTLKNLQYQRGEGLKSYANRNTTDISPYVTQKVAGTQFGQKFPMAAPILGLGAGMLTPSPSDALKVGKFARQAGDVAKFSDDATELVKPSMLVDNDTIKLYRGMKNRFDPNYDLTKTDAPIGYSTWTDNPELAKQYGDNVYEIELPKKQQGKEIINTDGDRVLFLDNEKKAGLNNISGKEYLIYNDHEMYSPNLVKEFKPKLDPLTSEAKKYKTAEEFVKGQSNYYYGGGKEITKIDGRKISRNGELGEGFYFTGDIDKAKLYGGTITNLNVELKNPLTITKDELWKKGGLMDKYNQNPKYNQELVKQGYDGVLIKEGNKIDQGIAFSPSQIKTKSQLTDIWNKAQGN